MLVDGQHLTARLTHVLDFHHFVSGPTQNRVSPTLCGSLIVYKSGLYGCGKMEEIETTPVAGKAAHHGPSELNMVTELLFNLGHFYLLPSALLTGHC
jgi:hypothetical protein